jgi:hypothetical protein
MSSAAQATCSECGATFLASTAARTGGICMACKQGIRKHIEESRVYYQRQREPDPFRDYWADLVRRVFAAPDGFYRLSRPEKTYYLGQVLYGEVFNGGMRQFFDNSSGDFYRETLDALKELGAMSSLGLLIAAKEILFPDCDPPPDQVARYKMMPQYPETAEPQPAFYSELERIDDVFYSDPDEIPDRLRKYALDHQLVQI